MKLLRPDAAKACKVLRGQGLVEEIQATFSEVKFFNRIMGVVA